MTEKDCAHSIAHSPKFDFRKHVVVRNVAWGLFGDGHEADVVVMTPAGYLHEIEIKTSRQDLRRDFRKRHRAPEKSHGLVRYFWYAGPEHMRKHFLELCPEGVGILICRRETEVRDMNALVDEVRRPRTNAAARKLSDRERFKVARLGTIRYWTRRC